MAKCNITIAKQPDPSTLYKASCHTHRWTSPRGKLAKVNDWATAHENNPDVHNESDER